MSAFLLLLAIGSGVLLLRAVRRFQREWRAAEIARATALPEQTVRIPQSGDLRLYLEGPRFRTWGKQLGYTLSEISTSRPVPIAPSYSGSGVRSPKYSRVERGRFVLPAPGDYLLRITGLLPGDPEEFSVVIMRPYVRQLMTFILTCVLLGMILIGSFVGALLTMLL